MKVTVDWSHGLNFVGKNSKRQRIEFGGDGDFVSPMENLLMSVGACSSIDVVMILQKARQQVTGCQCKLDSERAEEPPRRFTKIKAHFVLSGTNLSVKQVKRAVDLSVEKYCSVMFSLDPNMPVETSFEIIPV